MNSKPSQEAALSLDERLESLNIRYCTLLCLLASIDVLGPLATDAHLPSLPRMTSDLQTSPAWIQFSVLSYSFILALFSLFGGYLSDKYGRRLITIFGLIFFTIGGFGCAFAPSIFILNASRFIQGFGGGISCIITSSVARDVFLANERMKILGILGSLRPFAIAIAPVFGGWIAENYNWRMVFFVTSSIAVMVTIAAVILLPETKQKFFTQNILSHSQLKCNEKQSIARIIFSDYILLTISLMLAFRMVAVFVFLNEFPFVSHHIYGYNEFITGLLIGSGAIFLVIGATVSMMMSRMLKVNIMRLSAVCALMCCILLIIGPICNHWRDVWSHNISFDDLYTYNKWYFIVFPFCILTFSQGLNGPPSSVIVLEPYPHIAGSISAALVFWRLLLPAIVMIVITQIVSNETNHIASLIIYITMSSMAFLCFVLMFAGPLSKTNVERRMKSQIQIKNKQQFESNLIDPHHKHDYVVNAKQ